MATTTDSCILEGRSNLGQGPSFDPASMVNGRLSAKMENHIGGPVFRSRSRFLRPLLAEARWPGVRRSPEPMFAG